MNKRVSEIIRNGTTVNDIKTYTSLTCDDIWTVSNMLEDMVKNGKMDKDYVLKGLRCNIKDNSKPKKDKLKMVYSGGVQKWQNVDLMIDLFSKLNQNFDIEIITPNPEVFEQQLNIY